MATHLKNLSDFSHTTIPNGEKFKIAIVVAEWNAKITNALFEGALNALLAHGVKQDNIISVAVPGSFELTSAAEILLTKNVGIDVVICLGCVIQGETKHFDFICNALANGLSNIAIKHSKPVIFGVLTTNNEQQALDRAGGRHGNKGEEAAITALKMANFSTLI